MYDANFTALQRAYDNRDDTRYDWDEADAREQWEADTPVESMMSRDDMSEIILELLYGSTELALSVARYHADKAWNTYKNAPEEQDYGC